jgi:hypothetical protein
MNYLAVRNGIWYYSYSPWGIAYYVAPQLYTIPQVYPLHRRPAFHWLPAAIVIEVPFQANPARAGPRSEARSEARSQPRSEPRSEQ